MSSPINFGNRTFTQRELEIATAEFDEANLLGMGSYVLVYKAIIDDGNSVVAVKFMAIVLEYAGNGNLEQHLYPNGSKIGSCILILRDRLGITIDVAHGLEYLHEYCSDQVIHCDLKPQNVLLDTDMVAHVADFGVGKLILADKLREHRKLELFLLETLSSSRVAEEEDDLIEGESESMSVEVLGPKSFLYISMLRVSVCSDGT
ncbi:probable LRR receptor-like serine/threonine-protein kinase At3g47570 [Juglans microcarpa x Juglans regia]|uniref:probable LRR receptor-like serine/threonine-protein kinase At3g47570 n=1 Tax=Juglans microcarpa x Juglans regia TaxID=2249226 RepID=UPI001B7E8109|nr:probable LRR receptor-like serine/threonine-protein kinase At3g47570 [Juglans microcarpa x Juglans regia]